MDVLKIIPLRQWQATVRSVKSEVIEALERGYILLMPELVYELSPQERVLLDSSFVQDKAKNISFYLPTHHLQGVRCSESHSSSLKKMLSRFAQSAQGLVHQLFPHYEDKIKLGRTSFRPAEISGRIPRSYRKDDTRLHVDAFPASPTQGQRILRVFTNIHPNGRPRVWCVGEPFEKVATHFLPQIRSAWWGRAVLLNLLGLTKSYCTEYDYTMLQIHDKMKADIYYQSQVSKTEISFSPGSTWIVLTDQVSHAALAGQHVLEQTFYLPVSAMLQPELSPLKVLERLMGRKLV